ncbi:LCP family protein [Demequina lutea]|uniref:LCP family protein required for cell wall assembly n=1 Tax=Demequina lutea TaxID=431489 RepID=A0A7Y9Z8I1_9MICO|nr:LCP family protein [Demequina lutea]NYI40782.1 LCP family protein required for cell wall assembly [Demequina lutea]
MTEQTDVHVRHAAKRPGHPVLKGITWLVAATAGFGLVFVQTYKAQVESHITTEDIAPLLGPNRPAAALPPADGSSGAAVNILLMGSDSRSGANAAIGGQDGGQRNDTTLLMHVSADRTRIDVVSIPRDTIVKVPTCDRSDGSSQLGWTAMFNVAFANGAAHGSNADGAACVIKTVESLTGIHIDHFAVIDFVGFRDMVDAVGGVPVCIPVKYADPFSGTYLNPGPQVLNGSQAIAYVRMRHGINTSGSDLDRIKRQQEFLKNLASKVLSAQMLYRPQDVTNFIKAVANSLTVDPDLGNLNYVGGLAYSLRSLNPSTGITFATAPEEAYPPDPKNRVQFSGKAKAVWQAIIADQPIAPLLDSQSNSPANTAPAAGTAVAPTTGTATGAATVDPNSQAGILAACGS